MLFFKELTYINIVLFFVLKNKKPASVKLAGLIN
jgi:hypothetical protein